MLLPPWVYSKAPTTNGLNRIDSSSLDIFQENTFPALTAQLYLLCLSLVVPFPQCDTLLVVKVFFSQMEV